MYDAKNEAHEFTADTRDKAVKKAADYFGVGAEELRIGEFGEGDVYGLGGRVVIVASMLNRTPPAPGRSGGREEGGRGERPRRGGSREGRGGEGRGDRGDRGDRGGRGGRGGERGSGDSRGERGNREEREERAPAAVASTEPSVGTAGGKLGEVGAFLLGTIERIDVGPFEISENADGDLLVYEIRGAAAEALASGDGRTVDALQLLANQVAQQCELEERVVVDIEGNTSGREEFMAGLADRAASRARKTGRAVALDPMNGRDRRLIHIALRDVDDVVTTSVGEGRYRQVLIAPEGTPEFEQAQRESDATRTEEAS